MAWRIELARAAKRDLDSLDRQTARRILRFLNRRIVAQENPRSIGAPLKSESGKYWKYRVGDYRIVAHIQDAALRVLVLEIGHRREVYR